MSDINFIGGIVKIVEAPKQIVVQKGLILTKFRAQFPQVRRNGIVHLIFWSNLAKDVTKYYRVNDYILIEGYLSIENDKNLIQINSKLKKITVTVFKIYPIFLNYNTTKN